MDKASPGKGLLTLIIVVSIAVPVLVAILFFMPSKLQLGDFVYTLPHLHAVINSATAILMILALIAVKQGKLDWHRYLMTSAVVMGGLFLISYVIYHSSVPSVIYGDLNGDGTLSASESAQATHRNLYLIILISHIGLSMVALPLVLMALYNAIKGNFAKHKKIVKFAYPIWLYVSVTGVWVYWMMRPFYF